MNYRIIMRTLGQALVFEAMCMVLSLVCAAIYGETECIKAFVVAILACLVFGVSLMKFAKPKSKTIYAKEGYMIVALIWVTISIFGSIPFVMTKSIPGFIDALFETVSGFTTTGASVIPDLSIVPKSILFWRSFTHWIGGMGVIVFLVAILPMSGGYNLHLIRAESPGPSVSKIVPKVRSMAKILYTIYLGLTILQIILLLLGGMELFDSLTITFGTAGTGGFGISNSSIAEYSPYLQNVITVFMIIFGIDFSLYYLIILGKFKEAIHSDELKGYLGIIAVSTIIIMINCMNLFNGPLESLRHSAFQVASIITTTGYATTDFNLWPELSKMVLVVLMFIGACAGSTGGGIKVSRIMILFKSIIKEIKVSVHPNLMNKIKMNGRDIEHGTVRSINVYMASYLLIFAVSLLIISLDNLDFTSNFTAIATTINNVGPGLSLVGPTGNFSVYSPLSTFVMTLDMLIGRLEIFPMLVLFSPYIWKNK